MEKRGFFLFGDGSKNACFESPDAIYVTANKFLDVQNSDFYFDAVKWAVEQEITTGTSATTFSPSANCNRAQAVTFLWRAKGSPLPRPPRPPLPMLPPAATIITRSWWAVENGVTTGTSATELQPECALHARPDRHLPAAFPERDCQGDEQSVYRRCPNAFYANAVLWAVANDVTKGTSATTFSPNANCTRGQIVTFLYRAYL